MASIMNKVLADGNLTRTAVMVYGMYKGYYLTIQMQANQVIFLRVNYKLAETTDPIGMKNRGYGYMNQLRIAEKKVTGTNVTDHTIEVQMLLTGLAKNSVTMIDRVVNNILGFLCSEGAGSGCELCGSENGVGSYNVNGSPHFLCPNCTQASVNQMEAERQSKLNDKSNPALGLLGALIGSLLGVAIWVIIYQAGFIAGIAGAVLIIVAMKGYSILGKSMDKKGVIISIIVSLLMVFVANELSMRIAVYLAYKNTGIHMSFAELNTNWKTLMDRAELWGYYYRDLVIGYILTFVAGFGYIKQAFQNASGNYTIKKM